MGRLSRLSPPAGSERQPLRLVLRPVVQNGRIEVRPVLPHQCSKLGIKANSLEHPRAAKRAVKLTRLDKHPSVLSVKSVVNLIGVWRTSSVHPALWGAQIGVLFANSDCRWKGTRDLLCSKVICQSPFIGIE